MASYIHAMTYKASMTYLHDYISRHKISLGQAAVYHKSFQKTLAICLYYLIHKTHQG